MKEKSTEQSAAAGCDETMSEEDEEGRDDQPSIGGVKGGT